VTTAKSNAEILPDNAPHVLLVDDDQKIRDLLARYLTENGFRVTAAPDAAAIVRHHLAGRDDAGRKRA
jgi:two-component system, OmpR family, phosphate regulon response regulator OmpR